MTNEQKEKAREIVNQRVTNIKSIDDLCNQLCDLFLYRLVSIGLTQTEAYEIFLEITIQNMKRRIPKDKEFSHRVFDILYDV